MTAAPLSPMHHTRWYRAPRVSWSVAPSAERMSATTVDSSRIAPSRSPARLRYQVKSRQVHRVSRSVAPSAVTHSWAIAWSRIADSPAVAAR